VDDGGGGGVETGTQPEGVPFRLVAGGVGEGGGLGGGGALIEQAGVGDFESSEVDDHGLEVEESLEPALRNFGLVGGVGAVPTGILDDVAAEHGGCDGAVVTESDEGATGLVLGKDLFKFRQGGGFRTGGRKVGRRGGGKARRQGGLDKIFQGLEPKEGEHLLLIFLRGPKVAREERKVLLWNRGGSGLRGRRCLFGLGRSGHGHFCENKEGYGVGKG